MTERDLERRAQRRLAVLRHEEVSFNVAATCRHYGISRSARPSSVAQELDANCCSLLLQVL
jgi:hypothetical protein